MIFWGLVRNECRVFTSVFLLSVLKVPFRCLILFVRPYMTTVICTVSWMKKDGDSI